ncbi:helix-turn-helix domain-containing protein [Candidimonas humi]|uniref:IclR family transcriptional regulator C-terminal domain-containing protein n=1 Tax=Candidimonas humi TaxID=683355 RepID=A0ABV8P1K0_9BURK|nr:IclR family transcriptional regulator C-terminal domain-containing protein [Candidimonas humi]MBV6305590.1 helix-turn-helix domain-containing protein [Candidimonas humi]
MKIDEKHPDFVTAFARGMGVIQCFGKGAEQLTLTDVAKRTGLSRGTARRLLLTLHAIGYVAVEEGHFRLLPKILDLGYSYLASTPIWELAQPFMKNIVDEVDESCGLAVLDGKDVVYLARVPPTHIYIIPIYVGTRMPAYANAMGQVLLAELTDAELDAYFAEAKPTKITPSTETNPKTIRRMLKQVREQGYALPVHQVYEGRASLAVPIRNRQGRAVAAMNVSALLSRVSLDDFQNKILPLLQRTARQIQAGLS